MPGPSHPPQGCTKLQVSVECRLGSFKCLVYIDTPLERSLSVSSSEQMVAALPGEALKASGRIIQHLDGGALDQHIHSIP